jgi:hypothetical protein
MEKLTNSNRLDIDVPNKKLPNKNKGKGKQNIVVD